MNIRSTSIIVDSSCATLQGCTAACVGLKITEEQRLLICVCGQKQTNQKTTKKRNRKSSVQWYFLGAWQGEFQSSLSLDCPAPSLSRQP